MRTRLSRRYSGKKINYNERDLQKSKILENAASYSKEISNKRKYRKHAKVDTNGKPAKVEVKHRKHVNVNGKLWNVDDEQDIPVDDSKNKPFEKQGLTEYEKMVEKNREEKMAFLKSIKIDEVKESLSNAVKSLKENHKSKKRIFAPKPPPDPTHMHLRGGSGSLRQRIIGKRIELLRSEVQKVKIYPPIP